MNKKVLPGFGLTLGMTLAYVGILVVVPLCAMIFNTSTLTWNEFLTIMTSPRVLASYRLSMSLSFLAAVINVIFGLILAWVLVRYSFPGKRMVDALIDLPFALPTAVAGISLASLYAAQGWLGSLLAQTNIQVAFTPAGILVALIFIGIPFVVRTVQPVLEDHKVALEEAAMLLGASRWQTFWRVIFPSLRPSLLTGFGLSFARALGEYGSVIFIAGNIPMVSEIVPLLIVIKLEEYDYPGATAIAVVMLLMSFVCLLVINMWQHRAASFLRKGRG